MYLFFRQISALPGFQHPLRWVAVYSAVMNVLAFVPVLHSTQIYDRILTSRSISTLVYLTLIVIVCVAVMSVAEGLRQILGQRLSNLYAARVSEPLFSDLASGRHGRSDQAMLLRDLATVRAFLSSRSAMIIYDVPFGIMFLFAMLFMNFWLGLLTAAGAALLVVLSIHNKQVTAASRDSAANGASDAMRFAQVALQRSEDMAAMGLLPNVLARWGRVQAKSINDADWAGLEQAYHYGLGRFVRQVLQVLTMAIGGYLVIIGDMSGGMIFAASILSGKALQPIEQVIGSWDGFAQARDAEHRIAQALAATKASDNVTHLPDPVGVMTLEDLGYTASGREDDPPILQGVNLSFRPGSVVAVLGPSGAGKSTLARLLVGAIQPTMGTIRLDGFKLDQWDSARRGRAIGYVPQDIALFPGTVAENIARLDLQPDSEAIIDAAQKAGVHDLIARFPNGYDTVLGPGHHDISGGQRQRIALARAFYGRPKVLVLDEPNAHLDVQGEELLMRALAAARADGITVIVISQRQSILQVADQVVVVQDGRIASVQAVKREPKPTVSAQPAAPTQPAASVQPRIVVSTAPAPVQNPQATPAPMAAEPPKAPAIAPPVVAPAVVAQAQPQPATPPRNAMPQALPEMSADDAPLVPASDPVEPAVDDLKPAPAENRPTPTQQLAAERLPPAPPATGADGQRAWITFVEEPDPAGSTVHAAVASPQSSAETPREQAPAREVIENSVAADVTVPAVEAKGQAPAHVSPNVSASIPSGDPLARRIDAILNKRPAVTVTPRAPIQPAPSSPAGEDDRA